MALSKPQEIALFQILEVPYTTSVGRVITEGLVTETRSVTGSAKATKDLILAHLTAEVYPEPTVETSLKALLDAWIDLGTDTTAIEQGEVGNVRGLTTTVAGEREEIRKQTLIIVPFYRYHEQYSRGGLSMMVCR